MMNKYGFYKDYYCIETKEYIRIPHNDISNVLEKYANKGLTLEEVSDPYDINDVHIVHMGDI